MNSAEMETRKRRILRDWSIRRRVIPMLVREPWVRFQAIFGRFALVLSDRRQK